MRDQVEAILFAAGRFLDEEYIAKILKADLVAVRKALADLRELYEDKGSQTALRVVQEENSWKLQVKDNYLELVSKLVSEKDISTTVLETLAIIAWKNPIMQAELIKIRGPAGYEHVAELIERGFITKEAAGRSFKLRVTDKFFDYFEVEGRGDMRKLFKEVEQKAAAAQAAIEQQKAAYEQSKRLAEAAQKALDEGKQLSPAELAKLTQSPPEGSEHSAQVVALASAAEVADAVKELRKTKQAEEVEEELAPQESEQKQPPEDLIDELEDEIEELHEDINKLKQVD
jgi:segregation and condensation protein B